MQIQVNDGLFNQLDPNGLLSTIEKQFILKNLIDLGLIKSYGYFDILVWDKYGNLKDRVKVFNTITTLGINEFVDFLDQTATNKIIQLKVGSGTNNPTKADTILQTEATPAAFISGTHDQPQSFIHRISGFIGSTDYDRPLTINEIGCFFAVTNTMFARALLTTPIVLTGVQTATVRYGLVIG